MAEFYRKKKKVCYMCAGKTVDYKDVDVLRKYVNERGKILPRRVTGTCAKHQRIVAEQIKRARAIASGLAESNPRYVENVLISG